MTATAYRSTPDFGLAEAGGIHVLRRDSRYGRAACAMLFIGAGSWFDPPGRSGLAHLYEHAFFAGSDAHPDAAATADAIADLGCRFNAHTHREFSYFYLHGPATTARAALGILLASYTSPRWEEGELGRQRTIMLNELRRSEERHERHLRELTARALYGNTAAAWSPLGLAGDIQRLTASDLREHADRAAVPGRVIVVLDGDGGAWGDPGDVLGEIGEAAAGRTGSARPVPAGAPRYAPANGVHLQADTGTARLAVVVPGISYDLSRREMYALRLLHAAVGGGSSSRLQRLLRDELGLAYQVRSSLEPHQRTGAFLVLVSCAPEQAGKAAVAVRRVLEAALSDPMTAAEFRRAREVNRGMHVRERETAVDRCYGAAYELFRRGEVVDNDSLFDLWGDIELEEVRDAAIRHLGLGDIRHVLIGPIAARDAIDAACPGTVEWQPAV